MLWGKGNSFPIECEARLPVKACTFMLERQTALFRSLVDEARLFFYRHNSCSCHGCAQPVPETVSRPSDLLVSSLLPYVMQGAHANEPICFMRAHSATRGR